MIPRSASRARPRRTRITVGEVGFRKRSHQGIRRIGQVEAFAQQFGPALEIVVRSSGQPAISSPSDLLQGFRKLAAARAKTLTSRSAPAEPCQVASAISTSRWPGSVVYAASSTPPANRREEEIPADFFVERLGVMGSREG